MTLSHTCSSGEQGSSSGALKLPCGAACAARPKPLKGGFANCTCTTVTLLNWFG